MSHEFKPGDLALVVGAIELPEDVGLTVTLVEHLFPGQAASCPKCPGEICDTDEPAWLVDHHDETLSLKRSRHLMPLRGDFQPERQKSQEVPA